MMSSFASKQSIRQQLGIQFTQAARFTPRLSIKSQSSYLRSYPTVSFGLSTLGRQCASKTVITTRSVAISSRTTILDARLLLLAPIGRYVCLRMGQFEIFHCITSYPGRSDWHIPLYLLTKAQRSDNQQCRPKPRYVQRRGLVCLYV